MDSVCTAILVDGTGTVKDRSGRLGAIAGTVTAAGTLVLRDGGETGGVILQQPLEEGWMQIDVPGVLAFKTDVHATFDDSLEGALTLYFR